MNFCEQPGPAGVVVQCKTVLDFFMLFLTAIIWSDLVMQTNLYYAQSIASHPSSMPYQDITVNELYKLSLEQLLRWVLSVWQRWMTTGQLTASSNIRAFRHWYRVLVLGRFFGIFMWLITLRRKRMISGVKLDPLLIGSMLHFCRCIYPIAVFIGRWVHGGN